MVSALAAIKWPNAGPTIVKANKRPKQTKNTVIAASRTLNTNLNEKVDYESLACASVCNRTCECESARLHVRVHNRTCTGESRVRECYMASDTALCVET